VTGGGIASNLSRSLPSGLGARIETKRWDRPHVFDLIAERGISEDEMRRTFNIGIGFCLVVDPGAVDRVLKVTAAHQPIVIGEIVTGDQVVLD
jgi:phosphoribosylformylglycinamidine cyclo-ligase